MKKEDEINMLNEILETSKHINYLTIDYDKERKVVIKARKKLVKKGKHNE